MSKGDNSPGISRLAGVFQTLADKQVPKDLKLDFGVIQGDGSLLTNTFPIAIPKKDYQVCRHLCPIPESDQWETAEAETDGHKHLFQPHWKLAHGNRVLVAWVQNDAVVIDVLVEASAVV